MEPQLTPLAAILDLNTDLYLNCLAELTDAEAQARPPKGGNSILFVGAHLADSRHFLAKQLGQPLANPLSPYLADARNIEEMRAWPSLAELRSAWREIGGHLASCLAGLSAADLAHPRTARFPIADETRLGTIAFLVQHESYHVGQMAFLRRQLGHPAMAYTRGASDAVPGSR